MRALVAHAGGIEIWLPALLVAIVVFVGVRFGGHQDNGGPDDDSARRKDA